MSSSVWGLTSGSYSDYTVHGVYLDEVDANADCDRLNQLGQYAVYAVEEIPILEAGGPRMDTSICLICDMRRSDGGYTEHQWDSQVWIFEPEAPSSEASCRTQWSPSEHSVVYLVRLASIADLG
jgi:hypothetical protein